MKRERERGQNGVTSWKSEWDDEKKWGKMVEGWEWRRVDRDDRETKKKGLWTRKKGRWCERANNTNRNCGEGRDASTQRGQAARRVVAILEHLNLLLFTFCKRRHDNKRWRQTWKVWKVAQVLQFFDFNRIQQTNLIKFDTRIGKQGRRQTNNWSMKIAIKLQSSLIKSFSGTANVTKVAFMAKHGMIRNSIEIKISIVDTIFLLYAYASHQMWIG